MNPGEGVEIVVNEPFGPDNEHGMPEGGVHTEKVLRFRSRLPPLLRRVMPASVTEIHESSWFSNGKGSHCKTVYRNPFLGNRFFLSIESNHIEGIDTEHNAVNLSEQDLAAREIIYLDIAGNVPRKLPTEDPSTYVSEKTGRGKLTAGWWKAPMEAEGSRPCGEDESEINTEHDAFPKREDELHRDGHAAQRQLFQSQSLEPRNAALDKENHLNLDAAMMQSPCEVEAGHERLGCCESTVGSRETLESKISGVSGSACPANVPSVGFIDNRNTMTCYKAVKVEFTGFGMRRFVQRWITRAVIPNGFLDIHRKLFCWMDDWWDLTLAEIEDLESQTAENVRAHFRKHSSSDNLCAENQSAADSFEYEYM